MPPLAADLETRRHSGSGDLEVLAGEGDVLLGPQPAHQPHELAGAAIALGLIALRVAVGGEIVLAGDDVDPHPAAAEFVEGRRGGGEVGWAPVAGADRHQRLEAGGASGERGGDGEGVGPAPAAADQGAAPAVPLQRLGVAGQGRQAVGIGAGVAPVAGAHLIGDVPEEFGVFAHAMNPDRPRTLIGLGKGRGPTEPPTRA
jgi:hypothetical protein